MENTVTQRQPIIPLRFHTGVSTFFKENGSLQPASECSLEVLLKRHEYYSKAYKSYMAKVNEIEQKYTRTRIKNGIEETFVDYDMWEEEDPTGYWDYALAEFNGFNRLDMLEWEIDLKITEENLKNGYTREELEAIGK